MTGYNALPPLPRPDDWPRPEYEPVGSVLDGYGGTAFLITSFGYLHLGGAPDAHLTLDVRALLHNPHNDPAMRALTGLDRVVRDHVLSTPGTRDVLAGLFAAVEGIYAHLNPRHEITRIAIGCAGGRHRSVVLANELAHMLNQQGQGRALEVTHRDILRPVVQAGYPGAEHCG